jgi:3-hydroxyacyl-CoA dehydrogenase
MTAVAYAVDRDIAVLTVNAPPVNALSVAVRQGLGEGIRRANADSAVRGLVIAAEGGTFIAGADIKELAKGLHTVEPTLRDIQTMLESGKPSAAALHGTALGGGLELALACTLRVAEPDTRVGLPEVKLGLLPGGGGTQRLTRLCGPTVALDIILSGRHVPADEALDRGLIDAIGEDRVATASELLRQTLDAGSLPEPVIRRTAQVRDISPAMFSAARETWARKARGRIAPAAIIDCIEAACTLEPDAGLAVERERFTTLFESEQRRALIHVFLAERQARRLPDPVTPTTPGPGVQQVAVIGAGAMGAGIAMVFANAAIPVQLIDISADAVAAGLDRIDKAYNASVSRKAVSAQAASDARARISGATDYDGLAKVDLVIEAAPEIMELKESIFARLDAATPAHTVLATNTSSLDIDRIAAATRRPGQVLGLHFFSPAHIMKLVEVVRGAATDPAVIAETMALTRRLGKVGVVAGNCDGFIGNRMLQFYTGQSEFLMEQGASPEQIDRVALAFGMAMGPVAMRDLAGIDVSVLVRKARAPTLPPEERMSPILERMAEAGRLGRKNGKGLYRYENGTALPDPEAMAIIEQVSRDMGVTRRSFTDAEIRDRLFMPLVAEGARELEDGTATRAGDIDVVWVNGYGFPAHRGGPMFWGRSIGLDRVVAMAKQLGAVHGPRWQPCDLLLRLAKSGEDWPA